MKLQVLVALILVLFVSAHAVAQDASSEPQPALEESVLPTEASTPLHRTPAYRLDIMIPSVGVGLFSAPTSGYERTILTLSVDVRLVSRGGHGGMVRVAHGSTLWGSATAVELDYVFRARLAGDDRFGLGLDSTIGTTLASFAHNEATIPTGLALGGNVGLSLDFRAYGFVVSLGAQYRLLVPTEAALNGGASGPEHAITGTLGLGFGFWGV